MRVNFFVDLTEEEKFKYFIKTGQHSKEKEISFETSELDIFKNEEIVDYFVDILKKRFSYNYHPVKYGITISESEICNDVLFENNKFTYVSKFKFDSSNPEEMIMKFLSNFKELDCKEKSLLLENEKRIQKMEKKVKNKEKQRAVKEFIMNLIYMDFSILKRIIYVLLAFLFTCIFPLFLGNDTFIKVIVNIFTLGFISYVFINERGSEEECEHDLKAFIIDAILLIILQITIF